MKRKETKSTGAIIRKLPHTPEYTAWVAMRQRCFNPESPIFKYYGGRGITVCPEWCYSFENFIKDMGSRPSSKHSLDRKEVNGNYEPGNCRWATTKEQSRNRRNNVIVEYNGSRMTLMELAETTGINYHLLRVRLKQGLSVDQVVYIPPPIQRLITINGKCKPARTWAREYGISNSALYKRLAKGDSLEDIIFEVALKEFTINGITRTKEEWARLHNLTTMQLHSRMRYMQIEKALTYPNN